MQTEAVITDIQAKAALISLFDSMDKDLTKRQLIKKVAKDGVLLQQLFDDVGRCT